ncbi:MAG TPA: hypothetical protein VFO76_04265, partial [Candidatus Kapabacteria bacterium]|nr:hypothetical protein [Candidatus Kapabacteria bacterium]
FELTGNEQYKQKAVDTLKYYSGRLMQYPYTMPGLLAASTWLEKSPAEIVITGDRSSSELTAIRREIASQYLPRKVMLFADDTNTSLAPFAKLLGNSTELTVYYCRDQICNLPVHSAEELKALLK